MRKCRFVLHYMLWARRLIHPSHGESVVPVGQKRGQVIHTAYDFIDFRRIHCRLGRR